MFSLDDKVALVTGGGGEIGQAICHALAAAGATVVISYVNRRDQANTVKRQIIANNGQSLVYKVDVVSRASIRSVMKRIHSRFGGLDILVNNAGINKPTDFEAISEANWDTVLAVNLKGPFLCCQEALPLMRARKSGSIINIGSISGQYGGPRTAHYAASKAGLISLGQVVARYGARDNIRCNTLAVGQIESSMTAASLQSEFMQDVRSKILLGRFGTPDEVAAAVVFLASDAGSYITAQTININGGLYF